MDKRAQLKSLLNEDPKDSFLLFALAKEWEKYDTKEAIRYYLYLKLEHPNYLALYFHLGQLYYDNGKITRAQLILKEGLEVAQDQGDKKTEGEIQQLLLVIEMEE